MIKKFLILPIMSMLICIGCSKDEKKAPNIVRPVYTMTIPKPEASIERSFTGISKPADEIILSFRVAGKIVDFPIKKGDHVKKGTLIGKLDNSDFDLDIKKAQAAVDQAKSQLEKSKSDYDRTRLLYEGANVSKSILDRDYSAFVSAKSQLETANTSLSIVKKQFSYATLSAPVEGNISETQVSNYQTVQAGQPVAKLLIENEFKMDIGIPEMLISDIKMSEPVSIIFDSIPSKKFTAIVTEVGVQTSATSTYPVTLTIQDQDPKIRSGMAGEAFIKFSTEKPLIRIPASAVVSTPEGKDFVWIYNASKQNVNQKFITIGDLDEAGLQVMDGLKEGEIIITKGVHHLSEGMKVKILNTDSNSGNSESKI